MEIELNFSKGHFYDITLNNKTLNLPLRTYNVNCCRSVVKQIHL